MELTVRFFFKTNASIIKEEPDKELSKNETSKK